MPYYYFFTLIRNYKYDLFVCIEINSNHYVHSVKWQIKRSGVEVMRDFRIRRILLWRLCT